MPNRTATILLAIATSFAWPGNCLATIFRRPNYREFEAVAIALHTYAQATPARRYSALPPAASGDQSSRSWRVEILPQLEALQLEANELREAYIDSQRWDAPENLEVLKLGGALYGEPDLPARARRYVDSPPAEHITRFVAVVDPKTLWSPTDPAALELSLYGRWDDPDNTILLIEAPELEIPWTQPRDMSMNEAIGLLGRPMRRYSDSFFYVHEHEVRRMVAVASGSIRHIVPLTPEAATALLTRNGGESVTLHDEDAWLPLPQLTSVYHIKWDRIIVASAAVVFVLWRIVSALGRRRVGAGRTIRTFGVIRKLGMLGALRKVRREP
jgi:hypothetical protein